MSVVNGEAGFTELTKLNVRDKLYVNDRPSVGAQKVMNFNWNTTTIKSQQGFLGITDNGTGDRTFTFDGNMPNTNYGVVVSTVMTGTVFRAVVIGVVDQINTAPDPAASKTVSNVRLLAANISTASSTGPLTDSAIDVTLEIVEI